VPINETRTEIQTESNNQAVAAASKNISIKSSDCSVSPFKPRYHIDLSKVRYKLTNSSIERILHDNHQQYTHN